MQSASSCSVQVDVIVFEGYSFVNGLQPKGTIAPLKLNSYRLGVQGDTEADCSLGVRVLR